MAKKNDMGFFKIMFLLLLMALTYFAVLIGIIFILDVLDIFNFPWDSVFTTASLKGGGL